MEYVQFVSPKVIPEDYNQKSCFDWEYKLIIKWLRSISKGGEFVKLLSIHITTPVMIVWYSYSTTSYLWTE
jgi:hypothetical protein